MGHSNVLVLLLLHSFSLWLDQRGQVHGSRNEDAVFVHCFLEIHGVGFSADEAPAADPPAVENFYPIFLSIFLSFPTLHYQTA